LLLPAFDPSTIPACQPEIAGPPPETRNIGAGFQRSSAWPEKPRDGDPQHDGALDPWSLRILTDDRSSASVTAGLTSQIPAIPVADRSRTGVGRRLHQLTASALAGLTAGGSPRIRSRRPSRSLPHHLHFSQAQVVRPVELHLHVAALGHQRQRDAGRAAQRGPRATERSAVNCAKVLPLMSFADTKT
jgi:hypothetical protein